MVAVRMELELLFSIIIFCNSNASFIDLYYSYFGACSASEY